MATKQRTLKRSKSLKDLISRARKAPTVEDEELLPCRYVEKTEMVREAVPLTFGRPVKQKFVQSHVTTDDIKVRPSTRSSTRPQTAPSGGPQRVGSQRHTWPETPQERRERRRSNANFDTVPHLVQTPWELERHQRRPKSQRKPFVSSKPLPRHVFEQLPREIYHSILDQLESLHAARSTVDVVGLQTDLKALLLVNKRWHRVAREHLYREIWLPGNVELQKRKFALRASKTRLKLLLRTLAGSEGLASMVRHLRVTGDLACALDGVEQSPSVRRNAFDLVADIIGRCPNLEHFSGYSPAINDGISTKLFFPLALRQNLKAQAWNVQTTQLGGRRLPNFDPGDLLDCHDDWWHLETLVLCSSPDLGLGLGMVSAVIQRLPNLKHLMLSKLNRHDFHNGTLLSIPALRSLRLDHLEGITDQGIEQLAYMRPACSLESLSLIGLELTALRTIQQLFNNLTRLRRFTLVQETCPQTLPGMHVPNLNMRLASASLRYLHWDVLVTGEATGLIAKSIQEFGFPSLRKVKVPCDYDGAIQALCRPIAQQTLDATDLEMIDRFNGDRYERFLRLSQIQAQLRVRESRQQPSFDVVVHDENKRVSARHTIGSYVGIMESKIEYSLEPDVEDSHYALIDFGDIEAPKWVYERRNEMDRSVFGEQILDLGMLF